MPIVCISPAIRLTEGPEFAFNARWALGQHKAWEKPGEFLNLEAKKTFRAWRQSEHRPRYIVEQYLDDKGRWTRGGAGPAAEKTQPRKKDADSDERGDGDGDLDGAAAWDDDQWVGSETEEQTLR